MKRILYSLAACASFTASLAFGQTLSREVWTQNTALASHDLGGGTKRRAVAMDPAGSLFVGQEAPKLAAPNDFDLVIIKYDRCSGGPVWTRTFDYLGANRMDYMVGMDTDGAGNLYVAAVGDNGVAPLWVMLKFDSAGTLQWTQTYGGVAVGKPAGIKVDKAGWVAVAGTMQAGAANYVHALKLDPYTGAMGAVGMSPLIGTGATGKAMTVDPAGNIHVAADATVAAIPRCVTLRFPGLLTAPAIAAPTFQMYSPAGGWASAQGIACDAAGARVFTLAGTWIAADQVAVLGHQNVAGLPLDPGWNAGAPFLKPLYGTADKARHIAVTPAGNVVTLAETFVGYSDMLVTEWNAAGGAYLETDSGMGLPDTYGLYNHILPAGLKVDVTGRIYITGTGVAAAPAPNFVTEAFSPITAAGQLPDWYDIYDSSALGGLPDESMALTLDAARNVYVAGATYGGGAGRTTAIMIGQGAPQNDTCATPMAINFGTTAFTTWFANDTMPPVSPCGGNRRDVWFKWVAPCTGVVDLDTYGSCFDTILSVYTGTCAALVPVICNDNAAAGRPIGTLQSYVRFNVIAGTTYFFQVGGAGAVPAEGTGRITLIGPLPALGACPPAAGVWSPWRKFRLVGVGTSNLGGVWRISVPCCTDVVGLAPTAVGAPANVLAANLSASINAACPSFNSLAVGNTVWIRTRCGATAPFVFRVGPAGTPVDQLCIVPDIDLGAPFYTSPAMTCSYNPTLGEEAYPHADANDNGLPDILDIAMGTSKDVNANGVPDESENTAPRLNLALGTSGLVLSWQGTGFALQTSPNLGPTANWQTLTGATNSPVSVPLNQAKRFFRLISQ